MRGEGLTWFRKRRDGAVSLRWESLNACFCSKSSCYDQTCNWKAVCNTKNMWYIFIDLIRTMCLVTLHGPANWAPNDNYLHNCILGRWWLGQGGGGGEGENSPKTSSGEESGINNCYEKMGASGLWKRDNPKLIHSCEANSGSQLQKRTTRADQSVLYFFGRC